MKSRHSNKKGFTLIEMILVVAIIIILSTVLFFSVSNYLTKARTIEASFSSRNEIMESVSSAAAEAIGS